jgi:hypothetical protein
MRVLLLLLLPAPLLAQEAPPVPEPTPERPGSRFFAVPSGCEAFLTVQMAGCTVSHHFTCAADPEGWQRRADMDEGGPTYFGAIDAETQWVESFHVLSGHSERLGEAADPASLSGLIAEGRDAFDFVTESDEIGPTRYVGEDSLTGETVTIDGVTLDRTEYEIVASTADGTEIWRSRGQEFISRDFRMFLSGRSTITNAEETFERDNSPVEFVRPGEDGFLSALPIHGCGVVMSKAAG